MILVDTNVLINFWKNPTMSQKIIFEQNEIATCGVIKTEILRGAKSSKETEKLKNALECFEYLSFNEQDWIELAVLFKKLKAAGLSIPFQDGIIAYLAIKHNCTLWTLDKHFLLIKTIIPILDLYSDN
ncbi:MAG: PIN domain-containing protein [Spirochaetaceae bacterium]|nr:PIN domain-containing protein [Spirochaetaceae bacterium]